MGEAALEFRVFDRVRLFDVALVGVRPNIDQIATAIGESCQTQLTTSIGIQRRTESVCEQNKRV